MDEFTFMTHQIALHARRFLRTKWRVTRDEQKAITAFIAQSVKCGQPPIDVEADAIIRALFVRNPDAAYRMTMLAMKSSAVPERKAAPPGRSWLAGLFDRGANKQPASRAPAISGDGD